MNGEDETSGGEGPCFGQELVGGHVVDAQTQEDVARFRKGARARLYGLRRGMGQVELARQAEVVSGLLDDTVGAVRGAVIAGYWPIRGELDLRTWLKAAHEKGARVALPVVVEKGRPVEFHRWSPGAEMTRGIWNIPVPAEAQSVVPDVVLVPLLGVDDAFYRLGNGGGYYDMTLIELTPKARVIGLGHDFCRMATIFPQPWDVPMDDVILGDGMHRSRHS